MSDLYPTSRPYGQSKEEVANVQYAALILRTADLLHITSDRTPSVLFRLIAPSDPISQEEWARQAAVTAVRSKPGLDSEGNVDNDAPRDTIEVVAQFSDENGFFGLTAYLTYAATQLRQTYDWAEEANRKYGSICSFPWKHIDESQILTSGFLRDSFEFSLDTRRVLDLLTGHTLYNNTSVVIREIVQNAIDAIRVQRLEQPSLEGKITVEWDSASRSLSVSDNGTGMSQNVIERHLLRVGSSRYQDPEFRRQHPEFSPISRFGIGVLSTFMVADTVSILTMHPEDAQGRQLNLRSVHGRYLVRLFDKDEPEKADLGPHGTRVTLGLRPSASLGDVEDVLRDWVVVPGCEVELIIDGGEPVEIGYERIGDALRATLEEDGASVSAGGTSPEDGEVRVIEVSEPGLELAFAVRWSRHFQEWSVHSQGRSRGDARTTLGTAVEGIRVERGTPGYGDVAFSAMANATGLAAPRTDVSRSGLEQTPERLSLLQAVYRQYARFVTREIEALRGRGFSLTWRAQEAVFLVRPLREGDAEDVGGLEEAIASIPSVVVDDGSERRLVTPGEVEAMPIFWTVESNFFRSAESLLREMPSTASVTALTGALGIEAFKVPTGPMVTSTGMPWLSPKFLRSREISRIAMDQDQRRVDVAWEAPTEIPRWFSLADEDARGRGSLDARLRANRFYTAPRIGRPGAVQITGAESQTAVRAHGLLLVLPGSALAEYLEEEVDALDNSDDDSAIDAKLLIARCVEAVLDTERTVRIERPAAKEFLEGMAGEIPRGVSGLEGSLDFDRFAEAICAQPIQTFNAWAWDRSNPSD